MKMQLLLEGKLRTIVLEASEASGCFSGTIDGQQVEVDAALIAPGVVSLILRSGLLAGCAFRCVFDQDAAGTNGKSVTLHGTANGTANGTRLAYQVHDPRSLNTRRKRPDSVEDTLLIKASMAGRVVRVLVEAGSEVQARDGVVVIEAMKMQNEIRAPRAGRIVEVRIGVGEMVSAGQVLAVIE